MFEPNLNGTLERANGYDVHGRTRYDQPVSCPFSIVQLDIGAAKTTISSDATASRSSADELVARQARILVDQDVDIRVDDRFSFDGETYRISSVFVRRDVSGEIDHIDCTMEYLPR